jgi:hypothetical protein
MGRTPPRLPGAFACVPLRMGHARQAPAGKERTAPRCALSRFASHSDSTRHCSATGRECGEHSLVRVALPSSRGSLHEAHGGRPMAAAAAGRSEQHAPPRRLASQASGSSQRRAEPSRGEAGRDKWRRKRETAERQPPQRHPAPPRGAARRAPRVAAGGWPRGRRRWHSAPLPGSFLTPTIAAPRTLAVRCGARALLRDTRCAVLALLLLFAPLAFPQQARAKRAHA